MAGAMRGNPRSLHSLRSRLTLAAAGVALVLCPGLVFAADYLQARSVTPVGPAGGTYLGQGNFIANGQHIPSGTYTAPVNYNKATIGKLAKAALSGAARFAGPAATIYGVVELAGWAYDLTNGLTQGGTPQEVLQTGVTYWAMSCASIPNYGTGGVGCVNGSMRSADPKRLADIYCAHVENGGSGTWNTNGNYRIGCTGYPGWSGMPLVTVTVGTDTTGAPAIPGRVVTDDEMADAISSDPDLMRRVLHDPNGNPHRVVEVVDAENTLADALRVKYPSPTGEPIVRPGGPAISPGPGLDPNTPPDTIAKPDSLELPAFCTWAKTVCDFIEWVKADPEAIEEVELPVEDTAIEPAEWSSGIGSGGTCPAPVETSVSLAGYTYPVAFAYDPMCTFLSYLYWVLVGGASVAFAFIVAGLRR